LRDVSTPPEDVSSINYFLNALQTFRSASLPIIKEAICIGYVNSAGMGSETVAQNARNALLRFVDFLPVVSSTQYQGLSLAEFATCMVELFRENINNDRVLIPLLETIAFLFDMQIMQRLISTPFK
jgi:hypothetical protein